MRLYKCDICGTAVYEDEISTLKGIYNPEGLEYDWLPAEGADVCDECYKEITDTIERLHGGR